MAVSSSEEVDRELDSWIAQRGHYLRFMVQFMSIWIVLMHLIVLRATLESTVNLDWYWRVAICLGCLGVLGWAMGLTWWKLRKWVHAMAERDDDHEARRKELRIKERRQAIEDGEAVKAYDRALADDLIALNKDLE